MVKNMIEMNIFDWKYRYEYCDEVENDIKVMKEILTEIQKPQIMCYDGYIYDAISFNHETNDSHNISFRCADWIYEQNKDRVDEKGFRECLLKCAVEDEEWTAERNKNLTGVFYTKITFLPEIQTAVCNKLEEYIQTLESLLNKMVTEQRRKKEETERQRKEWRITKTYRKIYPKGGEKGVDGYIDAEYTSQNGEVVRMVSRDVFDAGCFSYPKRLEGGDIHNRELWTEPEKKLLKWLFKFGEFSGIRML